jgi:CO/xanthine dehydrogenase Mo-binding subunit/aerobic-type carbon monoxide dehydrogenase small subunit (CoxS/CutS family)
VKLLLNGAALEPQCSPETSLLAFLRDSVGLRGAKLGCGTGHCGACTVLVDGRAVRACRVTVGSVSGSSVETIEGLAGSAGELHAVQAAFLAKGAVQCGFCTPGMIMATIALLRHDPRPSDAAVRRALKGNICRCTGYVKILEAVRLAASLLEASVKGGASAEQPAGTKPGSVPAAIAPTGLGGSAWDLDGVAKVRGTLAYAGDLTVPGMLHGAVVLSDRPHGEVLGVDTSAACAVIGVDAVLTSSDVPGHNGMGSLLSDQPVLCSDRVRFLGDVVALVLAETQAAAGAGARAVRVNYRDLPGVFSPEDALSPEAPLLHPGGNVSKRLLHEVGDARAGLEAAAVVVRGHYETPFVEHAYLEPESALAEVEPDGTVLVRAPTQFPFELRRQLSAVLALPEDQVRVIVTPIGGAFGSKLDNTVEALAALGAWCTRRPVRITLSREESLLLSTKRHPYSMDYRVGFERDGRLLAVDALLISDAGPYTALSPRVIDQACLFACGPYRVPNVRVEGSAVFTNNANASAFRGFGINQAAVAMESLMNEAARVLGIDPFELRLRNALEVGDRTISGERLRASVAVRATIVAARDALRDEMPWVNEARAAGRLLGVGVACGFKNVGAGKGKVDDAGAIFSLSPDGRVLLRASAVDMGQGIRTALAQVAMEVLQLDPSLLDVVTGDTALTMRHGGAVGERQTLISGKAVEMAAREFRDLLLDRAARAGREAATLTLLGDGVRDSAGMEIASLRFLADEATRRGEVLERSVCYVAPRTYALADEEARRTVPEEDYRNYPAYAYATQVAIIEVNPFSGKVRVLKMIAAHDCGRAINPQKIEGQLEGSCVMGIGYALTEDYPLDDGRPRHRTYGRLGVPTFVDAPEIRCILIEDPEPEGPFGAKGISEVATVPATPAVLNAIRDAIGIRIERLPVGRVAVPGREGRRK